MPCFNQESPSGVRAPDLGAMSDHFTDHQVEEITLLLYSPMGLDLKLAKLGQAGTLRGKLSLPRALRFRGRGVPARARLSSFRSIPVGLYS